MISVIIPVYNVEDYLERCINSVVFQIEESDEIILVDDGSSDNSSSICDKYASIYNNVTVVHKQNQGLSMARNDGLKHSTQKYIMFLDSDDYLEFGCIAKFKKIIISYKCDLITAKAHWFKDDEKFHDKATYSLASGVYSGDSYINNIRKTKTYLPCAPFYVYRKEFLIENGFRFYPGILHEDEMWMPMILLKAQKVCYIDMYFYCNYRREGSITQNKAFYQKGASDICKICSLLEPLFKEYGKKSKLFKDRMTTKVLESFCESQNIKLFTTELGRLYPIINASTFRNYIKGGLFFISPRLYLYVHSIVKGF